MINSLLPVPEIIEKGDWIDLRASEDMELNGPYAIQARKDRERVVNFDHTVIPLGVAIQLPKGYEAVVNPRSSIFKNYSVMLVNSQGIIDNTYCGDEDQWFMHVIAFKDSTINEGDRICQFRIQLSQRATVWQKIKWLFSNGVKIKVVDSLNKDSRGGHGSTGIK